jgi:hypothetical protein
MGMFAASVNFGIYLGALIVDLIIAFICSRIAVGKGRGPVLWFILGFFFACITLVVVLLLPPKARRA